MDLVLQDFVQDHIAVAEDGCWNSTTSLNRCGYGQVGFGGAKWTMHCLSWVAFNGIIPEGMCVCHRCDNPKCANPDHLFLGTRKENMIDSAKKGRKAVKLTAADVIEIRRLRRETNLSYEKIGKLFNVQNPCVFKICRGERWGHLED